MFFFLISGEEVCVFTMICSLDGKKGCKMMKKREGEGRLGNNKLVVAHGMMISITKNYNN